MAEKNEKFHFPHYTYVKIDSAYMPSTAYVSLQQDGKTQCQACVQLGDTVDEGQLIASNNKEGVHIHSPIPGTIQAFEEYQMPNGTTSECIVIRLLGTFTHTGKETKIRSWKYDTSSRLVTQIKQQGVINTVDINVGSLSAQIEALKAEEKTLGVLLYDFDPSASITKTMLAAYKKEIFEGCAISARAMNADGILFFYNSKNQNFIGDESIVEILADTPHHFIPVDSDFFPNASPRKLQSLIQKNKSLIPEHISAQMQLCIDTTTALATYYGIVYALPFTQTFVEVNGPALHESKMFVTRIGTPIKRLLEECGGTEKIPSKIVTNGLIKGTSINDMNIPVTKYLKTITLLSSDTIPDQEQSLCIHCGLCRKFCPAGLLPDVLYSYKVNNFIPQEEIRLSAIMCDACGLCNTTCPSRLPLFQTITTIKEDSNETKI